MTKNKNHDAESESMPEASDSELMDDTSPEIENGEEEASGESEEAKSEDQIAELQDKLLRTVAEFDNYRKRVARQYDDMMQAANDKILLDVVEIADNLARALEHADKDTDIDSLRDGVRLIHNQMLGLLEKYNVKPIEAVGKPFDPNLHDALMQVDSEDYDEGMVAMEVSKGYHRGDRVLRHSKVGVSKQKD